MRSPTEDDADLDAVNDESDGDGDDSDNTGRHPTVHFLTMTMIVTSMMTIAMVMETLVISQEGNIQ